MPLLTLFAPFPVHTHTWKDPAHGTLCLSTVNKPKDEKLCFILLHLTLTFCSFLFFAFVLFSLTDILLLTLVLRVWSVVPGKNVADLYHTHTRSQKGAQQSQMPGGCLCLRVCFRGNTHTHTLWKHDILTFQKNEDTLSIFPQPLFKPISLKVFTFI